MSFKLQGVKMKKSIYMSQKYEVIFQSFSSVKSTILTDIIF